MTDHPPPITLDNADLSLAIDPARGGGITRFDWRDQPLMLARPDDPSPLGLACFPLLPWSNRIARGRFEAGGRTVVLPANHPGDPAHPHAIHGLAWQLPWTVAAAPTPHAAELVIDVAAGVWPWTWRGRQWFGLAADHFVHRFALENRATTPMPAGIGTHPYFPANAHTRLTAFHRGQWQTAADGLPVRLDRGDAARDWWAGAPVQTRHLDTVFTDRVGDMVIAWPDRGLALTIAASPELGHSVVYVPPAADHICVEAVSHMTDAVNRPEDARFTGLRWLAPGEVLMGEIRYTVTAG